MKISAKELPDGWQLINLGKLGLFSKGKGILKEQVQSVGIPCIRYGEIYTTYNYTVKNFQSFISEDVAKESKKIKYGDILFAGSGETIEEIGKSVAYVSDKIAFAGGDIIILSTNELVNPICLSYLLETDIIRKQKRRLGQGNSVVHIYSSDLKSILIPLPTVSEQNAFAKGLGLIDENISKISQLISKKELLKKVLRQQLLNRTKRLKQFSGDWKTYTYGDVLKVVKRPVTWDDENIYTLISVRRRSGGIFLRGALHGHKILVKDLRLAKKGDFLFSKMQILHGASALVTNEFNDTYISGSYIATIAKESQLLDMEFFNWYSQLPYFYHQTYISSYGVHIEKMTFDFETFLSLNVTLPTVEEQRAINNVLNIADKEIQLLKVKADKLKMQKKGMMQLLLTGKKRLKIN